MISSEIKWARPTSERARNDAQKAFNHTPEMPRVSNNFDAFLGTYDEWRANLLIPYSNALFQEPTGEVTVYGPLSAIGKAKEDLRIRDPRLKLFDPTANFDD